MTEKPHEFVAAAKAEPPKPPPSVNIEKIATDAGWRRFSQHTLARALFDTAPAILAELALRSEPNASEERRRHVLDVMWEKTMRGAREHAERVAAAIFGGKS